MRGTTKRILSSGAALTLLCSTGTAIASLPTSAATPGAQNFGFTGAAQSYVVPDDVCAVRIEAFGAQGGGGTLVSVFSATVGHAAHFLPDPGGLGGEADSQVTVTPGESLQVNVGGRGGGGDSPTAAVGVGGWNGGGDAGRNASADGIVAGGGGGGASDVRRGGTGLGDRIVVAGGGGGRGGGSLTDVGNGGAGGNLAANGADGSQQTYRALSAPDGSMPATPHGTGPGGGGGAGATTPGVGGSAGSLGAASGSAGASGATGTGGTGAADPAAGGGGGGGGLMGGGGGGGAIGVAALELLEGEMWAPIDGGGGGGSSLGDTTRPGVHAGDGQVTITPVAQSCQKPTSTSLTPTKPTVSAAAPASAVAGTPRYTG